MKNSIIATVGISMLTNFDRLQKEDVAYEGKKPEEMFDLLKNNPNTNLGAEVTSINDLIAREIIEKPKNLYLLTSGSEKDKVASSLVKTYFDDVFSHDVEVIRIKELNPDEPEEFRDVGLRRLVQATMNIIAKNNKNKSEFIINATGGYKAQVSFAGLVGQVLDIPVYYLFDRFNKVIRLPHMPIALDRELWVNNQTFFNKINKSGSLKENAIDVEVKQVLLDKDIIYIADDNIHLSSVGVLMNEFLLDQTAEDKQAYIQAMRKERILKDKAVEEIGFPDETPLSLTTLLDSIGRLSYVQEIQFTNVEKNHLSSLSFTINPDILGEIQATYYDGRDKWSFTLMTEASDMYDVQEHLIDLNLRYTNPFEKRTPLDVEFILIRHGQHVGEAEERIEGWADFELTEKGKRQAKAVAEKMKKERIDVLYTSSLARAKETAQFVGEAINLEPIDLQDAKAMNYGLSGGLTKFEAEVLYPKPRHHKTPHYKSWGSESELEFTRRVLSSFYEMYYQNPDKKVALVTHGRVISAIIREVMDLPITQDLRIESEDTSIHHFKFGPDKSQIFKLNDTNHLDSVNEGDE